MYKVFFNNGQAVDIREDIAKVLADHIDNGAVGWQIFSVGNTPHLFLNLKEIACIQKVECNEAIVATVEIIKGSLKYTPDESAKI